MNIRRSLKRCAKDQSVCKYKATVGLVLNAESINIPSMGWGIFKL